MKRIILLIPTDALFPASFCAIESDRAETDYLIGTVLWKIFTSVLQRPPQSLIFRSLSTRLTFAYRH